MKLIGGILMIAGTCIGGGMLGLPMVTAQSGILHSILLFFLCWSVMTYSAFATLEVAMRFPKNSNLITMAKITLGRFGEICSWTIYLIFLYALVAAYIESGQDLLKSVFLNIHLSSSKLLSSILFVFSFGSIVIAGTRRVDMLNRVLMAVKMITLFGLFYLLSLHINLSNYKFGSLKSILPALSVGITSFGFSIIIPTLKTYFNDDIATLRKAILGGSLCALVCYIVWEIVIFGAIPQTNLMSVAHSSGQVSSLMNYISNTLSIPNLQIAAKLFSIICIITAFMCVSLGLSDYIADGIQKEKLKKNKLVIATLTFTPPLLAVILYPSTFILFLSFAGLCCAFLQAFLPTLMTWRSRYTTIFTHKNSYEVFGDKPLLLLFSILSFITVLVIAFEMRFG